MTDHLYRQDVDLRHDRQDAGELNLNSPAPPYRGALNTRSAIVSRSLTHAALCQEACWGHCQTTFTDYDCHFSLTSLGRNKLKSEFVRGNSGLAARFHRYNCHHGMLHVCQIANPMRQRLAPGDSCQVTF